VEIANARRCELERRAVGRSEPGGGSRKLVLVNHETLAWTRRPALKSRAVLAQSLIALRRNPGAYLGDSSALNAESRKVKPPSGQWRLAP